MNIQVEIGQYKARDGDSSLKGFFTLFIYPQGQKVLDCKHFDNGKNSWFAFPSKVIEKDGKKDYIPLVSYLNKEYLTELNKAVNAALKDRNVSSNPHTGPASSVHNTPPAPWF